MSLRTSRTRLAPLLLLGVILVVAGALRLYQIDGQSFWADEGNSVVLATRAPSAIIAAAAADIHPPAYYLLLSAWGRVFGLDAWGARGLSALFGVALVAALYLLGTALHNRKLGLTAAALAAVNPLLVYYSQEARMYGLAALCAVLAAWAFAPGLRPANGERPSRLRFPGAFVLFAALGLYTHYAFALLLVAFNLVYALAWWRQRRRGRRAAISLAWWLGTQAVLLLLYLPWLPTALRQLGNWPEPAQTLGAAQALAETLRLFVCGPTSCPDTPLIALGYGLSLILLVLALLPPIHTRVLLPLIWLLVPVVAMLLFGLFTPAFFKFLTLAAPAFLLLVAVGIERAARWAGNRMDDGRARRRIPLALRLVLLILLTLPAWAALDRYYHDPAVARDDYRGIAAYLAAVAGPRDAVILDAPGQIDAFSQYDHGAAAVYPLPASRPLDVAQTQTQLDELLADHERIYAIYWAAEQADPDGVIERYLAENAFKAWDSWVGNLRFVAYSAEPAPTPVPLSEPIRFGDAITLTAVGASADVLHPGDIARLLLAWQAVAPPSANYKISVQLLDPANQVVAQVDSEPVGGQRPTTAWRPGETIADPYGLPVPLATPPGDYRLILALYDAASGQRLPVQLASGIGDHADLANLVIEPPASAPPDAVLPIAHRANSRVGPFTLLGHNRFKQGFGHAPDTPLVAGDALHLTTFWRADAPPGGDYTFDLLLDGRPIARFPLAGPGYPTSRWVTGQPWRGEHSAQLPAETAKGERALAIQLIGPDGAPVGDSIPLDPPLRVD